VCLGFARYESHEGERPMAIRVFGSAAKGLFDPASSDLDFIVQMTGQQEPGYARRFFGFAD
jgi:predicted nucleotidyltransferase